MSLPQSTFRASSGRRDPGCRQAKQRSAIPGDGGGTVIIYCMHTRVWRPQYTERRREVYTGRKKTRTYNTTIVGNLAGVIMALGKTCLGTMNELTMQRMIISHLAG